LWPAFAIAAVAASRTHCANYAVPTDRPLKPTLATLAALSYRTGRTIKAVVSGFAALAGDTALAGWSWRTLKPAFARFPTLAALAALTGQAVTTGRTVDTGDTLVTG
jgi:hypothetical protein